MGAEPKKQKIGEEETGIDGKLVVSVEKLQEIQDELEKLNEKASDEVLEIEQKYSQVRQPVYDRRNDIIKAIPEFWLTAFLSHPVLGELLTEEDHKIFKFLSSVEVEDNKDVKTGYTITFNFNSNPYFKNTKLSKTYTFLEDGPTKITASTIQWTEDKVQRKDIGSDHQMKKDMKDQDGDVADAEKETLTSVQTSEIDDWKRFKDDDIMEQHSAIQAEQAVKIPFVGDKEPLSSLEAEYHLGNSILLKKIKVLSEQYAAIRRTRGDGNCFFRSFMFGYLEHILESQDQNEVHRIKANIEECKKTLLSLGYAEFTFEDFFALFLEQLDSVLQGSEDSMSHDELLCRIRDPSISDYVVMFFRFVTSGEIRKRSEFFEPFVLGLTNASVEQFCKSAVEPMSEESDHVQIIALSDALGVPIRVVYLDRSSCENNSINVNHHDFIPTSSEVGNSDVSKTTNPSITLLYRPGHYDILYPK